MIIPIWLVIITYAALGILFLIFLVKIFVKRDFRCKVCNKSGLIIMKNMGPDDLGNAFQAVESLGIGVTFDSKVYVCSHCKTIHDQYFQPDRMPSCRACKCRLEFIKEGDYTCMDCKTEYKLGSYGAAGYKVFLAVPLSGRPTTRNLV